VTPEALEPDRRDFLVVAGNAFVAVGAASLLWPFIQQMNPDASTKALSSVEIDLSPVKEGQAITAMWRGKPIFIRNRTKEEVQAAEDVDPAKRRTRTAPSKAMRTGSCSSASARIWAAFRRDSPWAINAAPTAAGSARATDRLTTRQGAYVQARHRAISRCRLTRLRPTPRSKSAEGESDHGRLDFQLHAEIALGQMVR